MAKGPSPRNEARRRTARPAQGWEDDDDAPWLDEGDFDDGQTHTLVGRSTLKWIIGLLAVLAIGITVGILLVSKRESTPIDVPAIGEDVPVLKSPGSWKVAPVGEDVDGIPVEGQGQVLFGTGQGRNTDARIDIDTMPEDPLDKPAAAIPPAPTNSQTANAPTANAPTANAPTGKPPTVILPEAQRQQAASPIQTPAPAPAKAPDHPPASAAPGATAPAPARTTGGATVQLGAFSSQSRALAAYKSLAGRFSYLQAAEPLVSPTTRDGQTLYRLRVPAGSQAAARELCNRLKLAGEACTVVE